MVHMGTYLAPFGALSTQFFLGQMGQNVISMYNSIPNSYLFRPFLIDEFERYCMYINVTRLCDLNLTLIQKVQILDPGN